MASRSHPLFRQLDSAVSDRELLHRYIAAGDEEAFAILVDRHGPLVRGVCQRLLGDGHAVDDAVQATFLLLARKAAALANADAVGSWLFGVARRVSLAARRMRARQAVPLHTEVDPPAPESKPDWGDLLATLEEEIARLPEHLRAPLIACYLQGQTQDEAARSLGWSLSTLRRRLEEGRELLRSRLTTRGATPPAGLFTGTLAALAESPLAPALRGSVLALVAGGSVPASVAALVAAVGTTSPVVKGLVVAVGVALLAGLAYGATVLLAPVPEPPPPPVLPPVAPPPPPAAANPWAEPLPRNAVARLGTTAFRHGTDGPAGIVDPFGVHAVAFQEDGTIVSVGGEQVRFWNPATGEELFRDLPPISTRLRWLLRAHVGDGGRRFVLPDSDPQGTGQETATVWDLSDRRLLGRVRFAMHPGNRGTFTGPTAVAAGGRAYLQLTPNGEAYVWDAAGVPLARLDGKFAEATPHFLLPDGLAALTVEPGQRVRMWDIRTGKATREFGGELPGAMAAALSPDGRWLATLGEREQFTPEGFVRLWDVAGGRVVRELPWPGCPERLSMPARLAFSADGKGLVAAAPDGDEAVHFCRWLVPAGGPFAWRAPQRRLPPRALAYDAARARVVVASQGTLRVFDSTTGREFVPADAHAAPIGSVEFAPEGSTLLSVDTTGETRLWDETGRLLARRQGEIPARGPWPAAVEAETVLVHPRTPAAKRYAVSVYALLGGRPTFPEASPRKWPANAPGLHLKAIELSADGRRLAVGVTTMPPSETELGRVALIDLAQGTVLWQVPTAESGVGAVRFAPDGKRLAVGTTRVRLLNAATGAVEATYAGHRGAVTALAFRADGRRVASGSTDSTVLLWDCTPEEEEEP